MRPSIPTLLAGLLAAAAMGCAANPKPAAPDGSTVKGPGLTPAVEPPDDEPRHGEISFPRPERETCAAGARTPYHLSVRVHDDHGAAFPDVQVHLFPMGAGHETMATVRTNREGVANMVVNPPGVYAVAVAVGGFEPQIRALRMRPGCSGSAVFTLKLGPVAGQK
jgi:hypothetical protein